MKRGGVRPAGPADGGYPAKFAPRSPAKACALLLPVWGAAFVRKFLDFCLPTLLAPGNVPALAQALPTRFVLLTRSSDKPLILEHPTWRQLADYCDTDIQPIDDLIVDGNHHASITLAYVRALRAAGVAMHDTVFLFLVGDYLVADGSLRSVLQRIQAGASGVLAGSLQIADDVAIPLLRDRQQAPACDIALPPRLLANWALAHLDPRNAVVNGSLYDLDANKLLWSVNKDTLIGRFYLLHMIGIRPEVTDFVVGAPCDYAFIPELCPSNRVDVLTDSDDYLVVEMQRRRAGSLCSAPVRPSQLARSLSQWTTARHRQNAAFTLVFHARDVPKDIAETRAAASLIAEVANALEPAPQPHRGHPSWIGMMALQRAGEGLPDDCRRVLDMASLRGGLTSRLWRLRLRLLGHPPRVTACHPRWPDFHAAYAALRQRLSSGDRLLVLSASAPAFARWLEPLCDDITAGEWELMAGVPDGSHASAQAFDACLWVVQYEQLGNSGAIIERIAQVLKPGGRLLIFAAQDLDGQLLDLNSTSTSLGLHLRQSAICADEAHYVPAGWLRLALHRALASTIRANREWPRALLPALLGAGAMIIGAIFIGNRLVWNRRSFGPWRKEPSSILLAGRRLAKPAGAAIDCQNARGYDGLMQHPLVAAKAGTQITSPEQAPLDAGSRGNEGGNCVDPNETRSRIVEAIGAARWARRRG